MSERGFVKLSVVIAAVLGVGFVASAYLNFAQHQQSQGEQSLLQGQITDLTYQVKQDQIAAAARTSPSPSASPTVSPLPSSTVSPKPTPSPSPSASATAAKTATIKTQGNIHASATADSRVLMAYGSEKVGATVILVGNPSNGFQQITYNGVTGYINSQDLQ